jgi:hypothetical protein
MQIALLFLLFTVTSFVQTGAGDRLTGAQKTAGHPYTNVDLGFSYMPPGGLRAMTGEAKTYDSVNRQDAKPQFESLLQMLSGPDDQAADWAAIGITTYPRGRDKDKEDDVTAGFFTNYALGGGITTKREVVKIAGRDFSVSHFEKKDAPLTRYAIACTTVHKEKFLTFFFAGNNLETVQKLMTSMDTLRFQP